MKKRIPIPPLPSPVETAIKELMEEVNRRGSATIEGVIIHPSDLPTLGALITAKPLPHPQNSVVMPGRPTPTTFIPPERVQTMTQVTQLEQQLMDSLWALAEGVMPATPLEVSEHGVHMEGSSERIRRVQTDSVLILCPCKMALRFNRCVWRDIGGERCDEEVPVVEGGYANCVLHRTHDPATGKPWLPNSRFYRCDYFDGTADDPDGQCRGVATRTTADGRHWCSKEGHIA